MSCSAVAVRWEEVVFSLNIARSAEYPYRKTTNLQPYLKSQAKYKLKVTINLNMKSNTATTEVS